MQRKDFLPNSENTSGENRNTIFLITYAIVLIVALLNMNATMSFLGCVCNFKPLYHRFGDCFCH